MDESSEKIEFTRRWIRWEVVGLAMLLGGLLGVLLFGSNMRATVFGLAVGGVLALGWALRRRSRRRARP
jgi:hypothetical protein